MSVQPRAAVGRGEVWLVEHAARDVKLLASMVYVRQFFETRHDIRDGPPIVGRRTQHAPVNDIRALTLDS